MLATEESKRSYERQKHGGHHCSVHLRFCIYLGNLLELFLLQLLAVTTVLNFTLPFYVDFLLF